MSNSLKPFFLARFLFFLPVDASFRKTLESILLYIIQYIGGTSSLSQCQSANTFWPLSNDLFRTNTSAIYLSKNYLKEYFDSFYFERFTTTVAVETMDGLWRHREKTAVTKTGTSLGREKHFCTAN